MIELFKSFVLIIISITTGIIIYYKWRFQHWKRRGIPSAKTSIPFGSMNNPMWEPESFGETYAKLYQKYKKSGHKHIGLFSLTIPVYMPIDLELTKNIFLKDFNHFVDRGFYYNERDDPLSAHLFCLEGAKWKNLRAKLSPTFTSGKLKSMFPLVMRHALHLTEAINAAYSSAKEVEIKVMMGNYTADIIGSSAFGLDCNSFTNPNSEYRELARRFFLHTKFEAVQLAVFINNHSLGRFLKYCITPQEVTDFFMKIMKETVNYRETTNSKRNDFMQTLVELKNSPDPNVRLTFRELAAQAFIFFVGAIETSSSTLSFCMHELAMNANIQERAREEVNSILKNYDDEITYESISEMKYLQQVVDETLRKYPALPLLNRRCTKDYQIPGTNATLEKGTDVAISVMGIHHDEEYYPDHEKFDPERFNEINKAKLPSCCYLPFGEGPRVCIGVRFALMQVKVGIAMLLKILSFLCEKTRQSV